MISLKKMAAIGAVLTTMNFAKAEESKEVQFGPTDYDGGEIEKIELVNGTDNHGTNTHLLVRSNGKFKSFDMPYAYTGTNTQHFGQASFAQWGATNVNQYVVTDNGKVYMTFNWTNGVYTTQITSKTGPGVVKADIPVIDETTGKPKKDENGKVIIAKYAINKVENPEQDPIAKAILEGADGNKLVAIDGGDVFTVSDDAALINGQSRDYISQMSGKTKRAIFVALNSEGEKHGYVLADDNGVSKLYGAHGDFYNGIPADSVSVSADKKQLNIISGSTLTVYDTTTNKAVSSQTLTVPSGKKIKSAVRANGITYWATAKTIGHTK